jgi:ABC-type lipoprotein export system ATPase subunit
MTTHSFMQTGTPDDEVNTFIQMRHVVKTFKTPAGEFTALKGIHADFARGEFVSVIGKSGSGKSTLVNMLTGIDHPTSGQVKIGDTYVHKLNESQMARWRGRNLGIVFQFYQLLPTLSLLENAMLPMDFCDMYAPAERVARAMELLKLVGLADDAHKMPAEVSGGQQQRAAIARAMANDPPLIVADEPTGNLDSRTAETVMQIFEELVARGKTIVMVTHDPNLAQRTSRTLLLSDGEVVNETVASTLPLLTHRQMLKATKSLQRKRFAPGETIIHQGEDNDSFYMIAQGHTDVILERAHEAEIAVARLGPEQYFGEVTLLSGGRTTASVKAAGEAPVEVVTLDRHIFGELMAEAQAMREAIAQVARQRLASNAETENSRSRAQKKRQGRRGVRHAQASLA